MRFFYSRLLFLLIILTVIPVTIATADNPVVTGPTAPIRDLLEPEAELEALGLSRVLIFFEGEVDLALLDEYGAKLIGILETSNAAVCLIPTYLLEKAKVRDGIIDIVPDVVVTLQPETERRMIRRWPISVPSPHHVEIMDDQDILSEEEVDAGPRDYPGPVTVRWNNLEAGMNSQAAWNRYDLDGSGVKIAILDTGINYTTLPDLIDNYLGGYDFASSPDDDDPINPIPEEWHGTEVAVLAVGKGVSKIVGVAYNTGYYAIRVLQNQPGELPWGWGSDFILGVEWATNPAHKADVISMSFGMYDTEPGLRIAFENACNAAYNAGIILVAGSGNSGYTYSGDPAAFTNVISVGAHDEYQAIPTWSNGGVDVIAPGARVLTVHPDNSTWWVWGTSFATPHVSGLAALMIQYYRQNDLQVNSGYIFEAIRHSAKNLGLDPVYQGKGKAWAADTAPTPPDIGDGGIDLIAGEWPLPSEFEYSGEAYWFDVEIDGEIISVPAYYIGTYMYQDINLTNATNTLGGYPDDVVNLAVTATQQYFGHLGEIDLPGSPVTSASGITVNAGSLYTLDVSYYLPYSVVPGLDKTNLSLSFNFYGDPRVITYVDPYASIWCPPESINEGFPEIR